MSSCPPHKLDNIRPNPNYIPPSAIKRRDIPANCKSCGAPLALYELQCQYCGTICAEITPAETTFTCYANGIPYMTLRNIKCAPVIMKEEYS